MTTFASVSVLIICLTHQHDARAEQAHATRMVKATNVIYHDKSQPSALIVPVVP
jgi:predicted acyl esterase